MPLAPPLRPAWLKVRAPSGKKVEKVAEVLDRNGLRTVCRDAVTVACGKHLRGFS
jgi:lipoate synthase